MPGLNEAPESARAETGNRIRATPTVRADTTCGFLPRPMPLRREPVEVRTHPGWERLGIFPGHGHRTASLEDPISTEFPPRESRLTEGNQQPPGHHIDTRARVLVHVKRRPTDADVTASRRLSSSISKPTHRCLSPHTSVEDHDADQPLIQQNHWSDVPSNELHPSATLRVGGVPAADNPLRQWGQVP